MLAKTDTSMVIRIAMSDKLMLKCLASSDKRILRRIRSINLHVDVSYQLMQMYIEMLSNLRQKTSMSRNIVSEYKYIPFQASYLCKHIHIESFCQHRHLLKHIRVDVSSQHRQAYMMRCLVSSHKRTRVRLFKS